MAKHEAVDRLMALATEKRADRVPKVPLSAAQAGDAAEAAAGETGTSLTSAPAPRPQISKAATHVVEAGGAASFSAVSAYHGRQLLQAIRPLLPAIAGAMRLVDHGAVQAAARLLPLLGGSGTNPSGQAAASASSAAQERFAHGILEMGTAQGELGKQLHALQVKALENEEQLGRTRTQLERLSADQAAVTRESQKLSERVRLLTAGIIILLLLVIAQIILLAVIFHR